MLLFPFIEEFRVSCESILDEVKISRVPSHDPRLVLDAILVCVIPCCVLSADFMTYLQCLYGVSSDVLVVDNNVLFQA